MPSVRWVLPMLIALAGVATPARAQDFPGVREVADALTYGLTPGQRGPTVDEPLPVPRPEAAYVVRSTFASLAVHAETGVPVETALRALASLESAATWLDAAGWAAPFPDGGGGETVEFDLYLAHGHPHADVAYADRAIEWTALDAVTSFAVVDPGSDLPACVASAYGQAALLGQDPAEAETVRRAAGGFLAFLVTGTLGCGDGVTEQQLEPWRSPIDTAASDGEGGALFLLQLSARHDSGTGVFIREVLQLARQKSWERPKLRAAPDFWMALESALNLAGDRWDDMLEDFAVARYFTGARRDNTPTPVLRVLPDEATVPVMLATSYAELPKHSQPVDPPLDPLGNGYATVDMTSAPDGELRVWLRGEAGVRWSLAAVRVDAAGRELGRVSAPSLERSPNSYLVVEPVAGTASIVIVVTNLSMRLPDADVVDEHTRAFKLIVGR